MKIEEIMTGNVISVSPSTRVSEVARILGENRIGAVPVVDDAGKVVGIISESDLFLKEKGIPFSVVKVPQLFNQWVDPSRLDSFFREIESHIAGDVMSAPAITISPEESAGEAAALMFQNKISRLPVVVDGRLVGIVSRSDIIRWMAAQ
jgi:CBS domain-containing protein